MTAPRAPDIGPEILLPIPIFSGGERQLETVRAELVSNIAPHLDGVASFAVHVTIDTFYDRGPWRVSNIETGMRVTNGGHYPTKYSAIENARSRLAGMTEEYLLKALAASGPAAVEV